MSEHTPLWQREYECGCREPLDANAGTVASDACPNHGGRVRCVGYLTPEARADEMAEEIERLKESRDTFATERFKAEAQRDELLNCLKDMVKYYPCGCAPPDRCCCVCASYAAIARCEP